MGMCADGNCPECVAARERTAEGNRQLEAEFRKAGVSTFEQKIEYFFQKDRQERADAWRATFNAPAN